MGIQNFGLYISLNLLIGIGCLASPTYSNPAAFKKSFSEAEKYLEREEYDKAVENFLAAKSYQPKNPMVLAGLAEAYELQEKWAAARDVYKMLVDLFPRDYSNISRYLNSLKKSGTHEGQRECYKKLFEMNPKDMVQTINYLKFLEAGGATGADPDYVQVLEELSLTPGSHLFFANMLGQAQMEELAVDNQNRDQQLKQKLDVHETIASINNLKKTDIDTSKFQQKLMSLITANPKDETLLEAQGILYYHQKNYSHAKIFFNNMKKPTDNVHKFLAKIYFKREQYKEAAEQYEKLPENSLDQKSWEEYCDALASLNQKTKAKKEYKKLLTAYPNSMEGKRYLANN